MRFHRISDPHPLQERHSNIDRFSDPLTRDPHPYLCSNLDITLFFWERNHWYNWFIHYRRFQHIINHFCQTDSR